MNLFNVENMKQLRNGVVRDISLMVRDDQEDSSQVRDQNDSSQAREARFALCEAGVTSWEAGVVKVIGDLCHLHPHDRQRNHAAYRATFKEIRQKLGDEPDFRSLFRNGDVDLAK